MLCVQAACSGNFIVSALARRMANELYDALFERFVIWTLGGTLIKTADCLESIDHNRYPTLQQFAITCSFVENTSFVFAKDAEKIVTEWADEVKTLSECLRFHPSISCN